MRFARTKLFGVFRSLFRGIGHNLVRLGQLEHYLVSRGRGEVRGRGWDVTARLLLAVYLRLL